MNGRDVVRLVLLSAPRRPIVTKHAHRTSGVPLRVNCSCATRKQLRGPLLSVKNASPCADLELAPHANLEIGGLNVPAGTYSLYVLVKDPESWKLIVNKQTGQNGDSYDASMDLGRVDMKMAKPPAPVEKLKWTIDASGNTGKLQLEWENHIASVP